MLGGTPAQAGSDVIECLVARFWCYQYLEALSDHLASRVIGQIFRRPIHGDDVAFQIMQENDVVSVLKEFPVTLFASSQGLLGQVPRRFVLNQRNSRVRSLYLEGK